MCANTRWASKGPRRRGRVAYSSAGVEPLQPCVSDHATRAGTNGPTCLRERIDGARRRSHRAAAMTSLTGLSAFPITPAAPDGRVDAPALRGLLAPLAAAGVDSIGLLGSTGTYAYLSRQERRRALATALEA